MSEFISDIHEAFMLGKWSIYKLWKTFSYSWARYHQNTHLWQNRHNYPIVAQNESIFYTHKASMMVDDCTLTNKIHWFITRISQQIYICEIMDIKCYNLALRQGTFYIMNQVPILVNYILNMNKINPFFSEISQQA